MRLNDLEIGQSAVIQTVGGQGSLRQHFLDMGVIPGTEVRIVKLAPMGDPMQLRLHDYELTLRLADAEKITVELVNADHMQPKPKKKKSALHFAIEFFIKIAVTALVITILVIYVVGISRKASAGRYLGLYTYNTVCGKIEKGWLDT